MPDTPRLTLHRLTLADAPFILQLVNEPGWLRHIGDRNIHTLEAAEGYITKGPLASHAQHGFGLDLVRRRDTGEAIGLCGLIQRDYLDAPDIGYAFLQAHHGKGFASEAAAAVMAEARDTRGLRRLWALTSLDNHASMRVLEKCGFRFVEERTAADGVQSRVFLFDSSAR